MRQEVTKDAFTLVLTYAPDYPADAVSKRPETAEAAQKNVEELIAAVELLAENGVLPEEYRAHKLSGEST